MKELDSFSRTWIVGLCSCALTLTFSTTPSFADQANPIDETTASAVEEDTDPLEDINRFTSGFNRVLRDALIDPLVDGYQYVVPHDFQHGISNIFSNLTEPVTAVSSLLQGDTENASAASKRFLVNSTVGIGGIGDPATDIGIEQRREDLGQAFGANGVEPGPHIVLPILGPSNLRDATGDVLIGLANPFPLAVQAASGGVAYSDNQDAVKSLNTGAVDPYVAEREAYEQHRGYLVTNGETSEDAFPMFESESDPILATSPK